MPFSGTSLRDFNRKHGGGSPNRRRLSLFRQAVSRLDKGCNRWTTPRALVRSCIEAHSRARTDKTWDVMGRTAAVAALACPLPVQLRKSGSRPRRRTSTSSVESPCGVGYRPASGGCETSRGIGTILGVRERVSSAQGAAWRCTTRRR
jgi:hypothetical protein